jgi:hypothetical protein
MCLYFYAVKFSKKIFLLCPFHKNLFVIRAKKNKNLKIKFYDCLNNSIHRHHTRSTLRCLPFFKRSCSNGRRWKSNSNFLWPGGAWKDGPFNESKEVIVGYYHIVEKILMKRLKLQRVILNLNILQMQE